MMKTYSLNANLPNGSTDGFTWSDFFSVFATWRSWTWLGPLATIVAIGMLAVFYQVVRGAVQQGELQRKAHAVLVEANWRCKNASDPIARDNCRLQLAAMTVGEPGSRTLVIASSK